MSRETPSHTKQLGFLQSHSNARCRGKTNAESIFSLASAESIHSSLQFSFLSVSCRSSRRSRA